MDPTNEPVESKVEEPTPEKVLVSRFRFMVPLDDYRPIKWPIAWPYWCTGQSSNEADEVISIIMAYGPNLEYILEYWPEAYDIDSTAEDVEIIFTSRFPCPDWYKGPGSDYVDKPTVSTENKFHIEG